MAHVVEKLMTVAEFLNWDDGTDTRYELVRGRVVAMAPVSPSHSVIASKIVGALEGELKRPCYVGVEAGIVTPDRDDTFYEADVVVSCTPLAPGMATIPEPVVVIEVLSPSTIEHDRGRKAYDYRRIASVQEIVLVASEQRHIVIWRRRGAKWEVEDLIGDAALELESVGITLLLPAIYADSGSEAMTGLATRTLGQAADVIAPDGCEVRIMAATGRGSMAHFTLGPGEISRAVVHRTVEEVWYFLSGQGRMWRRLGQKDAVIEVGPGVSLAIPLGARFQLRNDGEQPLAAVAVTMPPWPGEDEACFVEGPWLANVGD